MLAPEPPVGGVFGLAYDWRREVLYAAAFHKRVVRYGPAGPGAIYQLDMNTGDTRLWAWFDMDSRNALTTRDLPMPASPDKATR